MTSPVDLNELINQALCSSAFDFQTPQPPKPLLLPADAKASNIRCSAFSKLQEEERSSKPLLAKVPRKKKFKAAVIRKKWSGRFEVPKVTVKTKTKPGRKFKAQSDCENLKPFVSLSKVNKRQLEQLNVTTSPIKNLKKVPYAEHPLARRAAEYKKQINATAGRNVSIVLYQSPNSKTPKHTIAITEGPPGGPHAELKAFDMLPLAVRQDASNLVFAVYTEREPCHAHDAGCARKLKSVLARTTEVFYTANHDSNPRRQLFTELEFQRVQAQEGIRLSACYEKNLTIAEELAREQNLEFDVDYYRNFS